MATEDMMPFDEHEPDYPVDLGAAQTTLLHLLSDLGYHTVDQMIAGALKGYKRGTVHEAIRLLRERGYMVVSPAKKMTQPYTFRLKSITPGPPRSQERCAHCRQKYRRIRTLHGNKDYIDASLADDAEWEGEA